MIVIVGDKSVTDTGTARAVFNDLNHPQEELRFGETPGLVCRREDVG